MKKILGLVATISLCSGLGSSIMQLSTKISFETNKIEKNHKVTNSKEPIINWKELDHRGYFYRMNDEQGVLKERDTNETYFLDSKGNFKDLGKKGHDFTRFNLNLGIFTEFTSMESLSNEAYLLDSKGNFKDLGKKLVSRVNAFHPLSENLGVFEADDHNTYFLDSSGNFTPLKLNGKSVEGCLVGTLNPNLGIFFINTNVTGEAYFLDSKGNFKDLGKKLIYNQKVNTFHDNLVVFPDSEGACLLDSKGNFTPLKFNGKRINGNLTDIFNQDLGVFIQRDQWSASTYLLDSKGNLKKIENHGKYPFFDKINHNLGVVSSDNGIGSNTCYFLDSKGKYSEINKTGVFYKFSENLGVFTEVDQSLNMKQSYLISTPISPEDIKRLEESVQFIGAKIKDIDIPSYKGKISNDLVKIKIDDSYVLENGISEIFIDGVLQTLRTDFFEATVEKDGNHEIVIKNYWRSDLVYELYIKKQSTITKITNTTQQQINKYVGADNSNNPIDILQSPSEVEFSYNEMFLSKNTISTLDDSFNPINPVEILNNSKLKTVGKYLIETADVVDNVWQQYLTIGSKTIMNYWDTTEGKSVEQQALLHKYNDKQLHELVAKGVQHIKDQYTSGNWDTKINLAEQVKTISLNSVPDSSKQYQDLASQILEAKEFYGLKLANPFIQYFDMKGKNIEHNIQEAGQFKVKIKASDNDPNWTGQTGLIVLDLKNDLSTLENLDLTDLIADKDKTYNDLSTIILNSDVFKNFKLINPTIKFMDMSGHDISNNHEVSGNFQIQIVASDNDPNWTGQTKKITLTLGSNWVPIEPGTNVLPKDNLSTIATVVIILGSMLSIIGIWIISQFKIIPWLRIKKMIKKHNQELKDFENKENLKE